MRFRPAFEIGRLAMAYGGGLDADRVAAILRMSLRAILRFTEIAIELQARQQIDRATAATFPWLSQDSRRSIMRDLKGLAGLQVESATSDVPTIRDWASIRAFIGAPPENAGA